MPVVPPFRPAAVVFDLDGLLVDSEGRWGEAERAVVASFGRPWQEEIRTLLLGTGPQTAAARLAAHLAVDDVAEVRRRMLAAAVEAFGRGIPVRRGASELVGALRGRVPLAIATNSERMLAEQALASAGLDGCVDVVVCVEDVLLPKPAPDPYARACRLLGVDASRSVAFEDSPVGMRSAALAGLWVVGCPSLPGIATDDAHVAIGSLAEVDPVVLLGGAPG